MLTKGKDQELVYYYLIGYFWLLMFSKSRDSFHTFTSVIKPSSLVLVCHLLLPWYPPNHIVLVEASAGFPFHSTFSFTLALGDVQLVVVPRSFLDQRIQLVLKVSVEEAEVFFPFLPRSCAEWRAAPGRITMNWEWKFGEICGQVTFYCSSMPWHTPPLKHQMSPLLLGLSILDRNFKMSSVIPPWCLSHFPPTLPCSRKPSSFANSEVMLLHPVSSSPLLQSSTPSQT